MRKLATLDKKKVVTISLKFRLKFLSFFRKINETSGNGKRSKFSSSSGPGVLLIFGIF